MLFICIVKHLYTPKKFYRDLCISGDRNPNQRLSESAHSCNGLNANVGNRKNAGVVRSDKKS